MEKLLPGMFWLEMAQAIGNRKYWGSFSCVDKERGSSILERIQTENHEFDCLFKGYFDKKIMVFYEALNGDITLIIDFDPLHPRYHVFSIEFGFVGYLSYGLYWPIKRYSRSPFS